jgi:hypothetical protein
MTVSTNEHRLAHHVDVRHDIDVFDHWPQLDIDVGGDLLSVRLRSSE